jgi:hypothetical protein
MCHRQVYIKQSTKRLVAQNDDLLQGLILSDGLALILEVSTIQYAPNY